METPLVNQEEAIEQKEGISGKGESLRELYLRRFRKHTLGKVGAVVLAVLYVTALFADFLCPFTMDWNDKRKSYHPPTAVHFFADVGGRKAFKPYTTEMILTNVAFKTYAPVPAYTMRAVSVEAMPGFGEMRTVATDALAANRREKILREASNKYSLPRDSSAMTNLAAEIDRLESAPEADLTVRVPMGMGEGTTPRPREILLSKGDKNFIGFLSPGVPYRFLGLFQARVRIFGSPTGGYFVLGTDQQGRDVFSRLLYGGRISLSVGLIGIVFTFTLGLLIGGLSGYFGGVIDDVLMRICEILQSFPGLYLLFALRAAFPPNLDSIQVYLLITVILAFVSWAGLARIIRGMVLSIKNEEYVLSAKAMGLSHLKTIVKHILPNTLSFVIIQVTVSIPGYILGESSLSFLGLGITDPQSSWGLMLSVAQDTRVIASFPWILIPGFAIFIAILAWSFFGDGIRDAIDPRSKH